MKCFACKAVNAVDEMKKHFSVSSLLAAKVKVVAAVDLLHTPERIDLATLCSAHQSASQICDAVFRSLDLYEQYRIEGASRVAHKRARRI